MSGSPTPAGDEVTKTLRIAARPETVWRSWTDPERMAACTSPSTPTSTDRKESS